MIDHRSYTTLCEYFFFRLSFDCLSCVYNCDSQSWLHIFLRSPNICSFIYSFAFFTLYGHIIKSRKIMLLQNFYSGNREIALLHYSISVPASLPYVRSKDRVPLESHPLASTLAWSVRNIHCPQRFTFEVEGRLRMAFFLEPGITKDLLPSPASKPPWKKKLQSLKS